MRRFVDFSEVVSAFFSIREKAMKCKLDFLGIHGKDRMQFRLTLFPENKIDQKNVSKMLDAKLLSSAHVIGSKLIRATIFFSENPQGDEEDG